MFSKLIALTLVAAAFAGNDDLDALDTRDTQKGTSSFATRLAARIAAAKANHGLLKQGVETAVDSIERVTGLQSQMDEAADVVSGLENTVPAAFADTVAKHGDDLTDMENELKAKLAEQLGALTKLAAEQNKEANSVLDTGLSDLNEQTLKMENLVDEMESDLKSQKECSANDKIWQKKDDKCVTPALGEDAAMDKVTHKMITGEDDREGGWLNNRDISFTKHYDDTYVRVIYYDNMRCHGHTSHGMWELEFCDGGGGGCAQCNNPGRLMHWRWSGHQHGWWMNDHTGGTITGLCKSTNSMQLTKGDYQIKVYLRDNRYDLHTGQNQLGSFMVDEVMKY